MRKIILASLIMLCLAGTHVHAQDKAKKQKKAETAETGFELKTMLDTISYIVGTDVAFTLKNNGMELNTESFNIGFNHAWSGVDTVFTIAQAEAIMVKYGSEMQAKRQKEKTEKDAKVIEEGRKFLDENKKNPDIIVTESGLQYQVIKQGDGEKPDASNAVHVHYKGMLLDGTVFDSSYDRGTHNTFDLGRLIPGWTEGIQMMPVGSIYKFFIPSDLGYGDREVGIIPANSTLIFEVELLGFE
jgi:FKBP-type peptidyl-prolyl cis-trans isomerase FkpA